MEKGDNKSWKISACAKKKKKTDAKQKPKRSFQNRPKNLRWMIGNWKIRVP